MKTAERQHQALPLRECHPVMMSLRNFFRRSPTERPDRLVLHGEIEQETDGRWIAEVTDLPGVLVYGTTKEEAVQRAFVLALRVLADRLEHGEISASTPRSFSVDLDLQPA